ncbi:MAG: hypothetical protein ABR502_06280 [Chitinophagaceae bacterium]
MASMLEEFEEQRKKPENYRRSITDYGMGVFFVLLGIFFLLYDAFNINLLDREPSSLDFLIGGLFIIYGGWRIYRGYKKNYFK